MTDQPIAYTKEGRPIFDNTPTVVAMLVHYGPKQGKIIVIRRANEPGRGLLGLPGGYHMRGETWQEAGCRELAEETGFIVDPKRVEQVGKTVTDEYGNNLMFGRVRLGDAPLRDTSLIVPGEVAEVLHLDEVPHAHDWAFPRHRKAFYEELLP